MKRKSERSGDPQQAEEANLPEWAKCLRQLVKDVQEDDEKNKKGRHGTEVRP